MAATAALSSAHPRLPFPSIFPYLSLDPSPSPPVFLLPPSRNSAMAVLRKRERGTAAVVLNSAKISLVCSTKRGVRAQEKDMLRDDEEEDDSRRRFVLFLIALASSTSFSQSLASYGKTKGKNPYDEKRLLEQNKRIQRENKAPDDFPNFIREGFEVKVVTSENYVRKDSGLIYKDFEVGTGGYPVAGQQVIFHYVGYNESGRRIDSTYLQGSPAKVRMGTNSLIPGFEEGIRDMKPGGKRRIVIPPELGPPVGPSTFFSSKQFEVFDVELLDIQNCQRRTIGFYSDVVCN